MAKKQFKIKGFSYGNDYVHIKLDMNRFDKQFQKAQYQLDGSVMNSMVPFMPMVTGSFVNVTRAASAAIQGSGKVYAAYGPSGRFLYEGKVMIGEESGSSWARKGERKVVTDRPLQYTKTNHPNVTDHWFDAARKKDLEKWVKEVKETAGGGKRG